MKRIVESFEGFTKLNENVNFDCESFVNKKELQEKVRTGLYDYDEMLEEITREFIQEYDVEVEDLYDEDELESVREDNEDWEDFLNDKIDEIVVDAIISLNDVISKAHV